MNKKTKWILVLAALVVAYPALAGLAGLMVKSSMRNNEERFLEQAPYLTVVEREYHGGLFESSQVVTYGIGDTSIKAILGVFARARTPLQFTVRSTIHHGPFPQHSSFGMAAIDSEFLLPEELQKKVSALLKGQPPFKLHTRMGWLGRAVTEIASPAFESRSDARQTSVTWRGLTGKMSTGRNLSSLAGELSSPGLAVQDPQGRGEMRDLRVVFDAKATKDDLYVGKTDFNIGAIEFVAATERKSFALQGLKVVGVSSRKGSFMDASALLGADAVKAAGLSVNKLVYEVAFKHIHAASMAALIKEMQGTMRAQPTALSEPKSRTTDLLRKHGTEILLNDPVLELKQIGFSMPEGSIKLSGTVSAPGLRRTEIDGAEGFGAVAKRAVAVMDFVVDESLIGKFMPPGEKSAAISAQIQAMEAEGYIKRANGKISARIEYRNSQVKMNGKRFNPAALRPATH